MTVLKRIGALAATAFLVLSLAVPVVLAADEALPHTGRVLVSVRGDVTLPAGEHADTVVVVEGRATIRGEVNTIVVVDGTLDLLGARNESVFAVRSPTTIGDGTIVLGDIRTLDAAVQRLPGVDVRGTIRDLSLDLYGIGAILAPAMLLLWVGFGLATVIAALALAGLASRQVRDAESLISREPLKAFLVGLLAAILTPILAILVMITVVGAPLGLVILLGVLPAVAFVGYLVAAIWIGDWLLRRTASNRPAERPYVAALIGVVLLAVIGVVPFLTAIASIFGFGAVILSAWRTLRGHGTESAASHAPTTVPLPA